MKPVIGVFPFPGRDGQPHWMQPAYLEAIRHCGGEPELLTHSGDPAAWEADLARCQGLLFTGGPDVNPTLYGQARLDACGPAEPLRDGMEWAMLRMAFARDLPVFGICRGFQLMNVALGGTLWQDLPSQRPQSVAHQADDGINGTFHEILASDTLASVIGAQRCQVNSYHHQGVQRLGQGLEVTALSEDGLIEAFRHPMRRCFFAVQWHPEVDFAHNDASRRLFAHLVNQCK